MKTTAMKRIISMAIAMITVFLVTSMGTFSASAASEWPNLSESSYCEFTADKTIPVYRNMTLKTRGTVIPAASYNAYVDAGDVCRIYAISSSFVLLGYPTSSGLRYGFVKRTTIFRVDAPTAKITSKGMAYTYTKPSGRSYGYVEKGDTVWRCGSIGDYTAVIYTAKSGNRAYKYAYVLTTDYNKSIRSSAAATAAAKALVRKMKESASTSTTSSGAWQYPLSSSRLCGNGWGTYYSTRAQVGRPYHCGLDLSSSTGDLNIYAAASGTVAAVGYNGANGYFVVIQHTLSGQTIYSFYCHLESYSAYKGQAVVKGQVIGKFGNSGSATDGPHLHFAIANTLSSSGGYYGYVANPISGDKTYYAGTTYYNPDYVIANGRLPG